MSTATPLAAATWPTSASSPSETSIIAVAPAAAAVGPGGVRRLGALVGLDQRARRAEAARQHGQAGGGPALPSGERHDVARTGARASYRVAVDGAERGDRDHHLVGGASGRRRPPRRRPARTPRRSPRARSSAHATGRSAGAARPTVSAVATAAHRVDVGQVRGGHLVADVDRGRPSRAGSAGCRRAGRWTPPPGRPGRATTAASSPGPSSTCSPCGNSAASARTRPNSPTSARVASGRYLGVSSDSCAAIQPQPPGTVFRRGHPAR